MLFIEGVDLLLEFFFVAAGDVQFLDRLLNVLHSSPLFFIEHPAFFFEALGTRTSVPLQQFLVALVNTKLGKFKLPLLVLSEQGNLLLLAFEFSLVLLHKSIFVLLEFDLTLFVKPVFLLSNQFLLIFLVLADGALGISLQLSFVVLHLLAQHTATVLRLHFYLVLQLSQGLFVFAFFLPLKLEDLTVDGLLHLLLLSFELTLEFPLQRVKFHVEFTLYFPLLSLQPLDVAALAFKLLVLLVFELLQFKLVSFFLTLFDGAPHSLVTASHAQFFCLQFLLELSLKVGEALLGVGSDRLHLFLLFNAELVTEVTKF